jgi:hypothetical protein
VQGTAAYRDQLEDCAPGKLPGSGQAGGGRSLAAGKAVAQAGSLNRVIDGRPLRDAGEVFRQYLESR